MLTTISCVLDLLLTDLKMNRETRLRCNHPCTLWIDKFVTAAEHIYDEEVIPISRDYSVACDKKKAKMLSSFKGHNSAKNNSSRLTL
jgi:hypothetical protein